MVIFQQVIKIFSVRSSAAASGFPDALKHECPGKAPTHYLQIPLLVKYLHSYMRMTVSEEIKICRLRLRHTQERTEDKSNQITHLKVFQLEECQKMDLFLNRKKILSIQVSRILEKTISHVLQQKALQKVVVKCEKVQLIFGVKTGNFNSLACLTFYIPFDSYE